MSTLIDDLTSADVTRVAELFAADMRDLGHTPSLPALSALIERLIDENLVEPPRSRCWVARPAPAAPPIGVILVNIHLSIEFEGDALWIEELYVDPNARRGGIGRLLVEAALDWAELHGYLGLDLEAYHGNTPAAVLYRSLGFHRLSRERFYIRFDEEK